ncbi:MAG: hypothetical protein M0Z82_02880 [Actinomycetota bacterium]|nr:hypothetical protein [Actinomycetota bacterium]
MAQKTKVAQKAKVAQKTKVAQEAKVAQKTKVAQKAATTTAYPAPGTATGGPTRTPADVQAREAA